MQLGKDAEVQATRLDFPDNSISQRRKWKICVLKRDVIFKTIWTS